MKKHMPIIFLLASVLLIAPASAYFYNYTVDATVPIGIAATNVFQGGQGHAIAKNSTGAIYVAYTTQETNYIYKLAWSTDGGTTWENKSFIPAHGFAGYNLLTMPEIAIDSHDTVHMVYSGTDAATYSYLEYRNYSLSTGLGDIFVLNDTGETSNQAPSISIDSSDVLHVIFASNEGYFYTNISPTTGIGTPYLVSTTGAGYPVLNVDQNDVVNIVYGASEGSNRFITYQNFSASGWGTQINMTGLSTSFFYVMSMLPDIDKIHILYRDTSVNTRYINATAVNNFKSLTPITIQTFSYTGSAMSEDQDGNIHMISQLGTSLRYYKLSSDGLSLTVLFPSLSGTTRPRLLWNANPPGNIISSGFEMFYSRTALGTANYSVYGPDPTPAPTPTPSPWSNSNTATTMIQGAIEMGLIVIMLATVSIIVIKRFGATK